MKLYNTVSGRRKLALGMVLRLALLRPPFQCAKICKKNDAYKLKTKKMPEKCSKTYF
jgi:hypothetical protein